MFKKCLLPAVIAIVSTLPAWGQMNAGNQMQNYNSVFGLPDGPKSFSVLYLGCDSPSNILFPGEQPEFHFQIKNETNQPLVAEGKADLIPFGSKGVRGDIWLPSLFANGDPKSLPIHVDIPAGGTQDLKVKFDLPEQMGGNAIILDLGKNGRVFGTTMARTFPPASADIPYPKLLLDANIGLDGLARLGVRTVRMEWSFSPDDPNYDIRLEERLKNFAAHHITVLMVLEAGEASKQPLGFIGRPWLGDDDVMLERRGNGDRAWMPEQDGKFQQWVADISTKYGWPKGPVTAVSLWNEPWEGSSISGWWADMPRYRELFEAMAKGVEQGRAKGTNVLIVGCDSSTNTWDKLFPDGKDTFLKWLDACTIHYQGINAPSTYKMWLNRKGPNGRVQVWDTESWVANTDDRVATIVATDRAAGYDRGMGVYHGDITTPRTGDAYDAWPLAASVGAAQHFIGERVFKSFLFQKGLPWIFVFDGLNGNADDGSVVIAGDLGESLGEDAFPFRTVRGFKEVQEKEEIRAKLSGLPPNSPDRADLQKRLEEPDVLSGGLLSMAPIEHVQAYDFYGNPLPLVNGQIQIPLDFRGYYIRTDGSAGSFAKLLDGLRTAHVDGYEPLEIVTHDAVKPLADGGVFRVTMSNVLNRPIQGKLSAQVLGANIEAPSDLSFAPFESKEIALKVPGAPRDDNAYPLRLTFDAGADGKAIHEETLHVNQIARKTIKVDGDLSDWKGVLPQSLSAKGTGAPTLTEAAWLPFKNFATNLNAGFSTSYMAYDDHYFYFASKVADSTPDEGAIRWETQDPDQFYYPAISYEIDRDKHLDPQEIAGGANNPADSLQLPAGTAGNGGKVWSSGTFAGLGFTIKPPSDKAAQLTFYLSPSAGKSGEQKDIVQIVDQSSGKILLHKEIENTGRGVYAVFDVKGSIQVTVRGAKKGPVVVGGLFLDASTAENLPSGTQASFVKLDSDTHGSWQGKYGQLGQWIAGVPPKFPGDFMIDGGSLVEHHWPDGVRRFSYRKAAMLPTGTEPSHDNVQIAFNVLPQDEKITISSPPGTMPDFVPGQDTDYEFALNKVAAQYGGGTEILRLRVPGMPIKNFYARQPKSPKDGDVKGGKLVVKYVGNTRLVETAIPWSEIPEVKAAADAGKTVKFSFRINDNQGISMELAEDRSVSKLNPHSFHTEWTKHWANEVEFGFQK